jgi:magnesium transporter
MSFGRIGRRSPVLQGPRAAARLVSESQNCGGRCVPERESLRYTGVAMASTPPSPPAAPTGVVNCVAYERGQRIGEVDLEAIPETLSRPDTFIWIGLFEPSEDLIRTVQQRFGLHDLAVEDALHGHQRPKLERYGDSLFVVLRTMHVVGQTERSEIGETHLFVGRRYVVTVRHGSVLSHVGLRARCEAMPHLLAKGPGFVLYALLDFVVDQFFPIVNALEDDLEDIESKVFAEQADRDTTQRIYWMKREVMQVKRSVGPLIDVCNRLMSFDLDLVPEDTRLYFRDVYDHVVRLNEMLDGLSQLTTTALEANLSLISVSQSDDTKRLAAWAAIIAVPTMLAGLWGMNFEHMPELSWQVGYPLALGVMAAACGGLFAAFKRSGWL